MTAKLFILSYFGISFFTLLFSVSSFLRLDKLRTDSTEAFPQYADELRGIAEGAEVTLDMVSNSANPNVSRPGVPALPSVLFFLYYSYVNGSIILID